MEKGRKSIQDILLVLLQVKEFHPDVCKDAGYSDLMIRHVIQAYKVTW